MRVPLSWLNEFLPRPMTAREVDDVLGEAGIAVTVIDSPGRLSRRVVAGRVRTADGAEPIVDLPTPERVTRPDGSGPCPPPGSMVAVALPGSRLFAPHPPGDDRSRYGLLSVPGPKRDGDPVGRMCSPVELGTGPGRECCVLPSGVAPGTPVALVLPATGSEEILSLTVPETLAHCAGLWGLAHEIASRDAAPDAVRSDGFTPDDTWSQLPGDLEDASHGDTDPNGAVGLSVVCADWTVSAVLVPAAPVEAVPGPLLARMTLAGIGTSDITTDALNIAAYEYGVRLAAFLVPGTGPVHVAIGEEAEAGAWTQSAACAVRWPDGLPVRLSPSLPASGRAAPGEAPRLLLLAASPSVLGTDGARCAEAARRAARVLSDTASGDVLGTRTASGPAGERRRITLDVDAVRAALGVHLTADSCAVLLARIGARTRHMEGEVLVVSIPPPRRDLGTQADLVSEVMRLYGYRALPATTPTDPVPARRNPRHARLRALRDAVTARGFQEALTPLVLDPVADAASDALVQWYEPAVHLERDGERLGRRLRRSLAPGLVAVAGAALRHLPLCAVFETGTVVRPERTDRAPGRERDAFAVLRAVPVETGGGKGPGTASGGETAEENLREVGAAVRAAVRAAGVMRFALRPADVPGFRPGTGAVMLADGVEAGDIGILPRAALSPRGAVIHDVAVAEIDLSLLLRLPRAHRTLSAPPRHPAVELDVNLLVPDEVPAGELPEMLCGGSPLVRSVRVTDVYRGRGVPRGHRAITVSLGFASPWRTLTRGEAATARDRAVAAVAALGVRRR